MIASDEKMQLRALYQTLVPIRRPKKPAKTQAKSTKKQRDNAASRAGPQMRGSALFCLLACHALAGSAVPVRAQIYHFA